MDDLTGRRFGKLTVLGLSADQGKDRVRKWDCRCDCGNTCTRPSDKLTGGISTQCKACRYAQTAATRIARDDLTGRRFGKLTVTGLSGERCKNGKRKWACACDCGGICLVAGDNLKSGKTVQCPDCRLDQLSRTHSAKRTYDDLTGRRFGTLTVIAHADKGRGEHTRWLCRCDCGHEETYLRIALLNTRTLRCSACKAAEQTALERMSGEYRELTGAELSGTYSSRLPHLKRILDGKRAQNNTSGATGVYIRRKGDAVQYVASITVNQKAIYLGTYSTFAAAKQARKAAEDKYFAPLCEAGTPGAQTTEKSKECTDNGKRDPRNTLQKKEHHTKDGHA